MQPDGSEQLRQFSGTQRGEPHARLSPDHQHLVFDTYRFGGWKIGIGSPDGRSVRRLSASPSYEYNASFSPDGSRLVYEKYLTDRAPRFADGNFEIFVINADGSSDTNLSCSEFVDRFPAISPDGKRIVFSSDRRIDDQFNADLYVMNLDGSNSRLLRQTDRYDFAAAVSPDSQKVAYISWDGTHADLMVSEFDGGAPRNLTQFQKMKAPATDNDESSTEYMYGVSWSPDGSRIAFSASIHGNFDIFVIDSDGNNFRALTTSGADDVNPHWADGE